MPNEIEALKKETKGDIGIGGANIASQAFESGLVDEIMLFAFSIVVGSGRRWIATEKAKRTALLGTKSFND